ncbi:LuxR family transcriptional regulator [Rhodococcus sp. NPDC060090]|uniref:LuxR family transcriptional regulator n=1 Tax=Rhodococcus sp. NPDC060090 TaxID=3347056 RepID=UPI003650F603
MNKTAVGAALPSDVQAPHRGILQYVLSSATGNSIMCRMNKMSIEALSRELHDKAAATGKKVVSSTVFGGNEKSLRQTLVVLCAGAQMGEHDSPKEATIYVISGRILLETPPGSWHGRAGALLIMSPGRSTITATEDSVLLLSVAMASR